MAFSSRARSRSSMLVESSSSRASDSRRSLARRAARRPASSRSRGGWVAGWASAPRHRSLHHSCVRGPAWTAWACASRASSSPLRRSQRPQLGAAQRGPVVVERVQATAAGVPHPSQLVSLVPVERLGEPRRGPHQPGRVSAVAGGRGPQVRRVVAPRVGRGPASDQPRDRGVLRAFLLEATREPCGRLRECGPLRARRRLAESTTSSARAAATSRFCRRKLSRADRAAARAACASPRASSPNARQSCSSARFTGEDLLVGQQLGRRPRTPPRATRRPAVPGSGRRRARQVGHPSASTRRRPRRTT